MKETSFRIVSVDFIGMILFAIIFWLIVIKLQSGDLQRFDYSIIETVQSTISDQLTSVVKGITFFGGKVWIMTAVIIGAIYFAFIDKVYSFYLVFNCGFGSIFNRILKVWIHRQRPSFYPIIHESGYSFPSGHSMNSFVLYITLALILTKLVNSKRKLLIIWLFSILLVLAIGTSRIYLGVHFPSDVLAGFVAGAFWVCFCSFFIHIVTIKRKELS